MPDKTHDIEWTDDGQPRSLAFGDQFFSREDGRAETAHVFLAGNGLPARWRNTANFQVAELGFGTGLNFLETWAQWIATRDTEQHLSFTSFEAFPMAAHDMARALARWPALVPLAKLLAQKCQVDKPGLPVALDNQTTLTVVGGDALESVSAWVGTANAWYLDGFSPARNPDMWSATLMQAVFDHTTTGGSFATYAAAGWVRRNLLSAGFIVERSRGFGAKREMLHGHRLKLTPHGAD